MRKGAAEAIGEICAVNFPIGADSRHADRRVAQANPSDASRGFAAVSFKFSQ